MTGMPLSTNRNPHGITSIKDIDQVVTGKEILLLAPCGQIVGRVWRWRNLPLSGPGATITREDETVWTVNLADNDHECGCSREDHRSSFCAEGSIDGTGEAQMVVGARIARATLKLAIEVDLGTFGDVEQQVE